MDKQVQLLAEPELQTFHSALMMLDGAITGLSFDSGGMVLFVHGSDILTDAEIISEAIKHPFIDRDAIAERLRTASKDIVAVNKGKDIKSMTLSTLSEIVIALAQKSGIANENGIIE